MTEYAEKILKAAVAGDGRVHCWRHLGTPGRQISAGRNNMIPDDATARDVQDWIGGVEDLEASDLLRLTTSTDTADNYEVTREGFAAHDNLVRAAEPEQAQS